MTREIKHCADCRNHLPATDTQPERCAIKVDAYPLVMTCAFQRGSLWLHDCGPDAHYWEPRQC